MRRILFAMLISTALLVVAPTSALAHHHRHHSHHAAVRHEQLGGNEGQAAGTGADENAGTIVPSTAGVLTIRLSDGSTVSGKVTGATEIECDMAEPTAMQPNDHGSSGSDNGGDSGQRGDNGNQDQNGDQGDDQGEVEQMCSTAALTPGTTVDQAELEVSSAGAIWQKVEVIAH